MQKEVLTPMKGDNFIFPVADGTVKVSGRDRRLVLNEERNKMFFEENQTDSLLQTLFKMTQHGMMRKLRLTSGLLREISLIAITLNPESNCTCRKKNHFLFHSSTSIDVTRNTQEDDAEGHQAGAPDGTEKVRRNH